MQALLLNNKIKTYEKQTQFSTISNRSIVCNRWMQSQSSKNALDDVIINEETNEISFVNSTTDPVELSYNYKKGEVVENSINVECKLK